MKYILVVFLASLLFLSCNKQSEISTNFGCETTTINNLEEIKDVKDLFSVQIPKTWKTNLFYDDIQSSIYTADTTKQLTETLLLDITFINKSINFDENFKLKLEQESLAKKLIQTTSKKTNFLDKPTFYTISKGMKEGFQYQICQIFIKMNEQNFLLAKAEVYGDSLVNKRICDAILLIEKIKTHQ